MELETGDKVLLQRALEQLNLANGVMRFLSDYFRDKYKLTPQHQITPDGTIKLTEPMVVSNGIGTLQEITGSENG